ncbi:VOC family protein [Paracoccus pacificus]|uniref:VOC family protein n=1 Tax=Paracoccus pacificus TaxID=1463598 RepID=A0ABW4R4B9_9RHOB
MQDAPRLYPILRFADPDAMIGWLTSALGFSTRAIYRDEAGGVRHAELMLGPSILMVGTAQDGTVGNGLPPYVAVDDADALHGRLAAAGTVIVDPLKDTDYGSRDFSCRDPEGNLWYFGTYRPSPSDTAGT